MQNYFSVCSSFAFWIKEVLAHPGLGRRWREVQAVEADGRSALCDLASRKLQSVLRHAATTVPYYRKWFSERGLDASAPQIGDFPILEKKDVRGHEEEFISTAYPRKRLRWERTSGSTGEPFRFAHGGEGLTYAYATLWRGLRRFGIRPGDRRVLVKGVDESPRISLKTKMIRAVYGWMNRCMVIDAHFLARDEANVVAALNRIIAYRPRYFHGYVSSIYLLAQHAERIGMDLAALKVKAIVTESEKCHDFQRELMERVFKAPVVETYGSVEFGPIALPAKDGKLCINEDHVYAETTADGEAVFTNLDEYGFPLIRFKNGDRLTLGPEHAPLPYRTIQSIEGRVAETIYLPQGGSLQGYIVMYPISKHMRHLRQYQVYQPDIAHLVIRVVPVAADLPKEIGDQIIREMREIVGERMVIDLETVANIPLTSRGKRAFVVSEVRKGVM